MVIVLFVDLYKEDYTFYLVDRLTLAFCVGFIYFRAL